MICSYIRVIPRDLFNEAKLLKCMGQLVLLIIDNMGPDGLTFKHDGEPFKIVLFEDGHLNIWNLHFDLKGIMVIFKTNYNSKSNYPLLCQHDSCDYLVFEDNGEFTEEFKQFCKEFKPYRKR